MRLAVYPGSFDPITNGHLDVLKRSLQVFDEVILLLAINPNKKAAFPLDERLRLMKEATKGLKGAKVDAYTGLTVDYCRRVGARHLIRGLRAVSDFEAEFQMAGMNRQLMPDVETVFLTPSDSYQFVSGTFVREIALLGGEEASRFVAPEVYVALVRARESRR